MAELLLGSGAGAPSGTDVPPVSRGRASQRPPAPIGSPGCLPPLRPLPPELPRTESVFGLELSRPGKVDSEITILNAAQLDSNFKKLHSLRVETKEKFPSRN